jgi:hypothetical protein
MAWCGRRGEMRYNLNLENKAKRLELRLRDLEDYQDETQEDVSSLRSTFTEDVESAR